MAKERKRIDSLIGKGRLRSSQGPSVEVEYELRTYQEFIDDCQPRFPGIHMQGAMAQGDRFHYRKGDLEALAARGN